MSTERNKIWTIGEIIQWGKDYLKEKSVESPRLSIELLLCHILGTSRLDLYLKHDKPLSSTELYKLKSLLRRLVKGEPLQYILGWTQFFSYKILLNRKVFIPRPETEFLVNLIFKKLHSRKEENLKILDIGCGSGAISVALAGYFKNSHIIAIDIDENAIAQTKENASFNNIANIKTMKLDILREIPNFKFDIIVSNPPYIPLKEYEELQPQLYYEPKSALTDNSDGLTFFYRFAQIFKDILAKEGSFYLEVGWNQAEIVKEIFTKSGFSVSIEKDFQGIKRIVFSNRFLLT